ncbi:cysteine--tRNA ligase [Sulfuriroseicoccus oceanibius]|uniref:Cysteine--tRNA ligase n=1 Tax=Sulfuriroseicoccus oceanibius TaxID=2707525 RepID=A0A6B3LA65_9BACT|nr:cysteine--tRNA ligase [Sulfuriroseicoccus oceanibius]
MFDTMARDVREMQPVDGKTLRFYCCGPTVYGPAHIGNFRTFVLQDVFRRVVELGGVPTLHVRNITDVDDKTIRDSQAAGLSLNDFTRGWTERFHADCDALGCLPPHIEPSAVEHIPQQISMIESLVDNGHAYVSDDGSVYFKISSFEEYGKLAHLDKQNLDLGKTANARSNTDEYEKDSVADFVLWKARKPEDGDNYWQSPWGEGRPGWHLECSAMIAEYLGKDFDLHSGGVDLVFPHHENEIAQSRCSCGGGFAAHWFHITHLLVDGGKMSKSLGNLYTLDDLAEKGHSAMDVRYVLAGGYYRRPLNFTLGSLKDARSALTKIARFDKALADAGAGDLPSYAQLVADGAVDSLCEFAPAWESLADDMNTPEALGHVFTAMKKIKPAELSAEGAAERRVALHVILSALGLELPDPDASADASEVPAEVAELAQRRWDAKQARDWGAADALRDELTAMGWVIKDSKEGFTLEKA